MKFEDPFLEYFGVGGKARVYLGIFIGLIWLVVGISYGLNWYKIKKLKDQNFESLENKIILSEYENEYNGLELIDTLTQKSKLITNDNYHDINPIIYLKDELIIFMSDRPDSVVNRRFNYYRLWVYDFKKKKFTPAYKKYKKLIQDDYSETRTFRVRDNFILILEYYADSEKPRELHKLLKFGDLTTGNLLHTQNLKFHNKKILNDLADSLASAYKER